MLRLLRLLGQRGLAALAATGRAGLLGGRALVGLPVGHGALRLVLRQVHTLGVLSLLIVVLSALAIGAVLGLQFYTQLARFGAEQNVGLGVAVVVLRELGPVVTALLYAGRAGSALTAEIGLMKATEQLASMEMMGVDPVRQVIAPRLWAGILAVPVLATVFAVVAIQGSAMVGVAWLGIDQGTFWGGMRDGVAFGEDALRGLLKSLVFGAVCTWLAVFHGHDCEPTAAGISAATTRSVVHASVAVLTLDFLLTLVMFGGS